MEVIQMKLVLATFAALALTVVVAHAQNARFPLQDGRQYAPGAVQMCLDANGNAVPTSSGACAGNVLGGSPVTIQGGVVQTTRCPPNPISKKTPPLC
jgi:hypothetical protein